MSVTYLQRGKRAALRREQKPPASDNPWRENSLQGIATIPLMRDDPLLSESVRDIILI